MTPHEMLNEFFLVIVRRKWLILIAFALGVAGVCGYTYLRYPLHKATVLILVHENPRKQPVLFRDIVIPAAPNLRANAAKNLIEISRSTDLARQIVNEYGLVDRTRLRAESPKTLRDKFWYCVSFVINVPFDILEWVGILEDLGPTYEYDAIRQLLDDRQDIQYIADTELVSLSVWEEDPLVAADIANRLAALLISKTTAMAQSKASVAYSCTEDLAREAQQDCYQLESELAQVKSEQNLIGLETQQQQLLTRIDRARGAYDTVVEQEESLRGKLAELREQLKRVPETIPMSTVVAQNPLVKDLELSRHLTEMELASREPALGEANPEMLALRAKVAEAGDKLGKEDPTIVQSETTTVNPLYQDLTSEIVNSEIELKSYAARGEALQAQVAALQAELKSLADKELLLGRLERRTKTQEAVSSNLDNKLAQLEVEQLNRLSEFDIRIVDSAYLPANKGKDWPSWKWNLLIGVPCALLLAFLVAFLVNYFDETFMTSAQLERHLGMPVLGCIPKVRKARLAISR